MPCAICLSSKRWYHDTRQLKCGHRFHFNCIYKWSHNNQSCPECRIKILPQKNLSIYECLLAEKCKHPQNLTLKQVLYKAGIEK